MKTNDITCFVCKTQITKRQLKNAEKVKDITGKTKYKHSKNQKCLKKDNRNLLKIRKSSTLNKRHYVKESDKKYNRNKEKKKIQKEIEGEL